MRALLALCAVLPVGCLPDTDLADEWRHDDAGAGGAAGGAELVDPAPGAEGVPPNLAAVVARLPLALAAGEMPFRVRGADGSLVPAGAPEAIACAGEGRCYKLPLTAALGAARKYTLELVGPAHAEDGAALKPGPAGAFTTGSEPDRAPPRLDALTFELLGACLRARFTTDETASARLVLRAGGEERETSAGAGLQAFDVAASLGGLPPDADGEALVRAADAAGNTVESPAWPLHTPARAPWHLVVTEVLANPAGPEPAQEFVELRNVGADMVTLGGLRLEDGSGEDLLPAVAVAPGAFVLVVPAAFNADAATDAAPRPGTALARVDSRLGGDGLANGGEPVRLRSPEGTLLSSYGGFVDTSASSWNGRSVQRQADDACDVPPSWNKKPLPATPGWQ